MRQRVAVAVLIFVCLTSAAVAATPTIFYSNQNFESDPVQPAVSECPDVSSPACFSNGRPMHVKSVKPGTTPAGGKGGPQAVIYQRVAFFEYPNYQGLCGTAERDMPTMDEFGTRNHFGSFKVNAACPPQLVLYSGWNYDGVALGVTGAVPQLSAYNFNDLAVSMRLKNGATSAAVYVHDNYQGACVNVTSDVPLMSAWSTMNGTADLTKTLSSVVVNGRCGSQYTIKIISAGLYTIRYSVAGQTGDLLAGQSKSFVFTHATTGQDPPIRVSIWSLLVDGSAMLFFHGEMARGVVITTTGTTFKSNGTFTCDPMDACPQPM